ncbi:MAG: dihydroorotate dehydrogenase, partial [Lachnospiraceae bacterium]|nr:dihydroorotate dehydrogenase [Lachnospiraceae bacterium]
NFVNPYATVEIVKGIEDYMKQYNVENLTDLIGAVHE